MPGRGQTTEADRQLIGEVRTVTGRALTASQLKRWRAAGLLPSPKRLAAGRGAGRRSTHYPEGTAALAVAVAEVVIDRRTPLRHAAAAVFRRGFDLSEQTVKAAYTAILDDFEAPVRNAAGNRADAADNLGLQMVRRAKRSTLGQTYIARGGTYGARRNSQLADALTAGTAGLFAGTPPSEEAAESIKMIYGAPQLEPQDIAHTLNVGNTTNLQNTLHKSTVASLSQAREVLNETMALFGRVHEAQTQTGEMALFPGIGDLTLMGEVERSVAILVIATAIDLNPAYMESHNQLVESAQSLP